MAVQWRASTGVQRVGALLAVGVGATALAGCSAQPGAAAVVDGTTIPTSDVRVATDELRPYLQDVSPSNVLTVLVHEPTIVAVAEEHGVGVSDEEAVELLESVAAQRSPDASVTFSQPSLTVARYSLAYTRLQELEDAQEVLGEALERIAALDVEVNPRFGSTDDTNAVVAPTARPWIVVPQTDGAEGAEDGGAEGGGAGGGGTEPAPEPTPSAS